MALFRPYQQASSEQDLAPLDELLPPQDDSARTEDAMAGDLAQDASTPARPAAGRRKGRGATRADLVDVQRNSAETSGANRTGPERSRADRNSAVQDVADTVPAAETTAGTTAPAAGRQPQKKGAPTPTRAQAQAARMERLHPTLSPKEQRRVNRETERNARVQAMAATEQTPGRQLVRDHVDARMTLTEWIIPAMLAVMAVTLGFQRNYAVQQVTSIVMVGLFVLWLVNVFWVRRSLLRIASERGIDVRQRGMFMYLTNRMMTMRALRRPAPRIKRGESY